MNEARRESGRFSYLTPDERESFELCRRARLLEVQRVVARDGRVLDAYAAGPPEAPVVLLANPVGVSCLFFVNLVARLVPAFRVITWETRGLPSSLPASPGAEHREWAQETQAGDLVAVLEALAASGVEAVVSYCSGCYAALHACAGKNLGAPRLLCLISPPLEVGSGFRKTSYQETFVPLLARMAQGSPKLAALVRALLGQGARPERSGVEAELARLNDLPFQTDESTYLYARLHHAWRELPWEDLLPLVDVETLVLHGDRDDVVHVSTARALTRRLSRADFELVPGEGHFAVFHSDRLIERVVSRVQGAVREGAVREGAVREDAVREDAVLEGPGGPGHPLGTPALPRG